MISYRTAGEGNQTLILLHGFCEDNTCFDKQVLFFNGIAKVILPDLPGFGKSAEIGISSIDQMAHEVKALLDSLSLHQCVMIGHSMGGYVALAFAELYPECLTGFGLLHSTARADNPERKEKRKQVASFVMEHGTEEYVKNFVPGLFAQGASPINIDKAIKAGNSAAKEGISNAALAMMIRPERINVLETTGMPVFFGIGKKDQLIPEEQMFEQAGKCKTSWIAYFEESAHMAMYEEPEKLTQEILGFLSLCN